MDRWLAFSLWILSRETEWLFAWFFTHYCHLWILQQQTMFLKPHFSVFSFILLLSFVILSFQFPPSCYLSNFSKYTTSSLLPFRPRRLVSSFLVIPDLHDDLPLLHYFFITLFHTSLLWSFVISPKNLYSRPHFYVLPASPSFSSFPHQQGFWSFARNSGGGRQQADSEEGGWCCQHHLHLRGQE